MFQNSYLSYEKYDQLKKSNELNQLQLNRKSVHQKLCRYALVDNLINEFYWDYWLVVTAGYFPDESTFNEILSHAHYRLDHWLMTNLKLSHLNIDQRSKWICLPERGGDGHLHYNCFVQLGVKPDNKTYFTRDKTLSEWNTVRLGLKRSFQAIEKEYEELKGGINFTLDERRNHLEALKMAMYSTKEMTTKFIDENKQDHFAKYIRSWVDWQVQPMNKRSGKKIRRQQKPSVSLEQFM